MDENRIIARFMGFEKYPFENKGGKGFDVKLNGIPKDNCNGSYSCACYGDLEYNIEQILGRELKYHKCWNWLMPVVDKIRLMNYKIVIEADYYVAHPTNRTVITDDRVEPKLPRNVSFNRKNEGTLLDTNYKIVVDFIKWYNDQPQE